MSKFDLTEKMQSRAVKNIGNPYRFLKAFQKARNGEKINYVALGGSITQRFNASDASLCYAALVAEWWRKAFPKCELNYVNAGIGATGSVIGLHRAKRDVINYNPDFVIIEYSVNDAASDEVKNAYDNLINNLLNCESKPAILLICMVNKLGETAQCVHEQIGKFYDLPIISYCDVVWPEVESGRIPWEAFSDDRVHPNDDAHALISKLVTDHINDFIEKNIENYSDNICNKYYTDDRYKNAVMYYYDDIEPKSRGCFVKETAHLYKMPWGWTANENGSPLVFKFPKCRNIGVVFERTNSGKGGKCEISIGEEKHIIDSNFPDGWGIYADYRMLFSSEEAIDITMEFKPMLKPDEKIIIVGIMVS